MIKFSFTLSGDPMPKERPRLGRGGRVFTPAKTLAYEHEIAHACNWAMSQHGLDTINQPVAINMQFERRTRHEVDLDNLVKAVLDGLNGIAFTDDQLVYRLTASKVLGVGEDAKVTISIEVLPVIEKIVKKGRKKT